MARRLLRPAAKFTGLTFLALLLGLELLGQCALPGPFVLEMTDPADRETYEGAVEQMFVAMRPNGPVEEELDWYDPDLGWDRPGHLHGARPNESFPDVGDEDLFWIVATGDSYTYGAEVGDEETYPYFVQQLLPGSGVLNLAVEGYGLDQALLKYRKYGRSRRPDVILLGVALEEYMRAGLPFYFFNRKPVYRRVPGTDRVELRGLPVPPTTETYAELSAKYPHPDWSYLVVAARGLYRLVTRDENVVRARTDAYHAEMRVIVGHILSEFLREAEATGSRVLVVQIPNKHSFGDAQAVEKARADRSRGVLLDLYAKKGIPYVDLLDAFAARFPPPEVKERLYTEGVEGLWGSGHLSPEGNRLAAELVVERIAALGLR